jgi:hypothetical protein
MWSSPDLDARCNAARWTAPVFLASTVPFALAAAFFPAGLATMIWLLSAPPALRRGVAYLGGAAVTTVASGAIIMALMRSVGGSSEHPGVVGGFELGMGIVLLGLAVWLVVRRPAFDGAVAYGTGDARLRLGGEGGVFLLGMGMWTPSFAYLAALQQIADAELGVAAMAVNLFIVDVVVLSALEVPLAIYALSPERAARTLSVTRAWLLRLGWRLASAVVVVGGIYLFARGWQRLT